MEGWLPSLIARKAELMRRSKSVKLLGPFIGVNSGCDDLGGR